MEETVSKKGHISAFVTVLIWGTAFISTRVLLTDFIAVEILFYRFSIALLVLLLAYPRRLKGTDKKQELVFAAAGLCFTLYFLLENLALTHTAASNVGVIISTSPFFTALIAGWLLEGEKPKANFFVGFLAAIVGILLISFSRSGAMVFNPVGDLLALAAAFTWSVYSIVLRKVGQFGHHTIQTTRRIFGYGLVILLPVLFLFLFEWGIARFAQPVNLLNILFLGLGASAICFATWNVAVRKLGAVKTSVYLYLVPVITVVASVLVLEESVTWLSAIGTILTLVGLFVSGMKFKRRSR
ncbi:MAG: DMT family transporter [Oscillospiraceae bacterium]|nr:DMT family transporter [Oscillospiraceae bacterium]